MIFHRTKCPRHAALPAVPRVVLLPKAKESAPREEGSGALRGTSRLHIYVEDRWTPWHAKDCAPPTGTSVEAPQGIHLAALLHFLKAINYACTTSMPHGIIDMPVSHRMMGAVHLSIPPGLRLGPSNVSGLSHTQTPGFGAMAMRHSAATPWHARMRRCTSTATRASPWIPLPRFARRTSGAAEGHAAFRIRRRRHNNNRRIGGRRPRIINSAPPRRLALSTNGAVCTTHSKPHAQKIYDKYPVSLLYLATN